MGSFAVNVEIVDAATGGPGAEGARLVIRDGTYADSAVGGSGAPPVLAAGPERPGVYDVEVARAGYAGWTRQNGRVSRGRFCNDLRGARLVSRLSPL